MNNHGRVDLLVAGTFHAPTTRWTFVGDCHLRVCQLLGLGVPRPVRGNTYSLRT